MRKTSKRQENIYKGELKLEVAPQNQSFFKALLEAAEKGNISQKKMQTPRVSKISLRF